MADIRCFLIEPTGNSRRYFRRYTPYDSNKPKCPNGGYHDASVLLDTAPDQEAVGRVAPPELRGDPRWPTQCERCGYLFQADDAWHLQNWHEYMRVDTGELTTIYDAPLGAIWVADWLTGHHAGRFHKEQRGNGPHYVVRTPGGDWDIDAPSSNANGDGWVRRGTAPDFIVSPSIQIGSYHGHLGGSDGSKPGYLVSC